jgi:hypothetical protein
MSRDSLQHHTPEYWCLRADEARAVADGLTTEANRQQMLEVANCYERLGEQARREQYS